MTAPNPELTCPHCGRPRAIEVVHPFGLGPRRLPVDCPCEAERREAEARRERIARREERIRRLLRQSRIGRRHRDATFETFEVTEHSAPILEVCRVFVARFPDGGHGLTLAGRPGTGRTHLSVAITRALVEREVSAVIANVPELLMTCRTYLRTAPARFDELLELLCRCDHLVLDDLDKERPTEWVRETLYLVVNARYEACLATTVTTNLEPDALAARVGEAILDRLAETNTAYWCEWKSHRRRRRGAGEARRPRPHGPPRPIPCAGGHQRPDPRRACWAPS